MVTANHPVRAGRGVKGRRYLGSEILFITILTVFVLLCVIPVIHVIALSLSDRQSVLSGQVTLWPKGWDVNAYRSVFYDASMQRSMIFSIILTIVYTLLAMVCSILIAYPLSRSYLPGKKFLMVLILIPMYFTGGTIPNYLWIKDLRLIDNPWSLVLPILTSTYNIIIMRNFFSSISPSLEESARLDGCNDFQILVRIVLPLSTASLATVALFYAVARWNSYADVRYYINNQAYFTLQMKLYQVVFNSTDTSVAAVEGGANAVLPDTIRSAAIVFSTVPILIVYPFLQKYFVQGVMIGAVKE
ncbi:MAG: carbohydrate ABC transporter permease [Clostridia bacterium]|nr:carbohydrate ABC transporter permease [Clostridia bacterium]